MLHVLFEKHGIYQEVVFYLINADGWDPSKVKVCILMIIYCSLHSIASRTFSSQHIPVLM